LRAISENKIESKPRKKKRMEWSTYTPDGREVHIRRDFTLWVARCGDSEEFRSELLDVALAEAIHSDQDVAGHTLGVHYGVWARQQADAIEREFTDK
jgi:hypothetical protein